MPFNEDLLKKREELISKGVNPYPYSFAVTHAMKDLHQQADKLLVGEGHEAVSKEAVAVAGRITATRRQGKKVFFADVEDFEGHLQVYLKQDILTPLEWETVLLADIGDWIGVRGKLFKTKTGELTIAADKFEMLGKAVVRVPISKAKGEQTFYQLADPEIIYRQRYLHWITNKDARLVMVVRARVISEIRKFMEARGFLEVVTPTIETIYGGASARPFETTIHALSDQKAYLRISPELPLKKFIAGGFPKVFTICQNFRNEGIDHLHNPEFTMMEWYEAFTDYEYQMKQFEDLVSTVIGNVTGSMKINFQGVDIDFTPPWKRVTMIDALRDMAQLDVDKMSESEMIAACKKADAKFETPSPCARGLLIAFLFESLCEKKFVQPTFVLDHPIEISPLTKKKRGNPQLVERFEPYVNGVEIGNAYSELTDPVEQFERLKAQREYDADSIKKDGVAHHPVDTDFVEAMGLGMPPTGGVGLGIDRLIMFVSNQPSIRDIIAFPMMRQLGTQGSEPAKV